jgi:hypothetical protein
MFEKFVSTVVPVYLSAEDESNALGMKKRDRGLEKLNQTTFGEHYARIVPIHHA